MVFTVIPTHSSEVTAAVRWFRHTLSSSNVWPAGPAVRNPQGAPGAKGQPEAHPEREGAATCRETGRRHCLIHHKGQLEFCFQC